MTTKHTPRPLVVVDNPASGDWYVIKDPGTGPFKARDGGLVAWVFTSEADALLFAAAPDMLAALRFAFEFMPMKVKVLKEARPIRDTIVAAIAKAEGGE